MILTLLPAKYKSWFLLIHLSIIIIKFYFENENWWKYRKSLFFYECMIHLKKKCILFHYFDMNNLCFNLNLSVFLIIRFELKKIQNIICLKCRSKFRLLTYIIWYNSSWFRLNINSLQFRLLIHMKKYFLSKIHLNFFSLEKITIRTFNLKNNISSIAFYNKRLFSYILK